MRYMPGGNTMYITILVIIVLLGVIYMFSKIREGFQDDTIVAGGQPVILSKEDCGSMKSTLEQYISMKAKHKDLKIEGIDEVIQQYRDALKKYGCGA